MTLPRSLAWLVCSAFALCACTEGNPPVADGGMDTGAPDSGGLDAGAADSGSPGDAGSDAGSIPDAGPSAVLSLALHRDDGGSPSAIWVTVSATDDAGMGVAGLAVDVSAAGVTQSAQDLGGGMYQVLVVPPFTSGELPIAANLEGQDSGPAVTALVLPTVGDAWDQPRSVGGLVNTPATEDSSTVSPDGEWLIVGSYLVVDALCCVAACGTGPADGRNSSCQDTLGPTSAPARPDMPGADRIVSPSQIIDADANLCLVSPDGGDFIIPLADGGTTVPMLPPTAAYGFHRQPDGSFAEPFLIHFADDGFSGAPFCFTFLGSPANGQANVIFAYHRDDQFNAPHQPTFTTLTLGVENVLGAYACVGGAVQYSPGAIAPLAVSPASQNAGNTSAGGGYLWSDDESAAVPYTIAALGLPDGGFAPWTQAALPEPSDDRRQPVLVGDRVFYFRNATVASAVWTGADPSQATSFGQPETELAGDFFSQPLSAGQGRVIAVGQPTFASRPGGVVEMYFVYYRRTATGFDGQIGVVATR
jgi:hypothetical protein